MNNQMVNQLNAVILHGICDEHEYFEMDFPSPSNAHWLPWLQQKFLRAGVLCQKIEMPAPFAPKYAQWSKNFEQLNINDNTVIVAHSAGCGFILKWLTLNNVKVKHIILVAPWLDINKEFGDFLTLNISSNLSNHADNIDILYSTDESVQGVKESVRVLTDKISKATIHKFYDKGHFCLSDLQSPAFPELWDIFSAKNNT